MIAPVPEPASAGGTPRVVVVVVNFNAGDMLLRCLADLERQTFRAFRVVVVDNASSDDSMRRAEQAYPWIDAVRLSRNVGFALGNNIGAARAPECDWIACLNPDAYADPEWLTSLMRAAQAHPEYSFFGSKLILSEKRDHLDGTGDIYHVSGAAWRRDHNRRADRGHHVSGEIFAPCAAASLYRRDAFEAVGGFDGDFFCYFEDVDLAFRLRLKGYRCYYAADAIVYHMGSGISGDKSPFTTYHGHRNLVWTFFKNMPLPLLASYLLPHVLLNLASIVVYTFKGQPLVILRAKRDAILGLPAAWRKRHQIQAQRSVSCWELFRLMEKGPFKLYRRA